MQRYHNAVQQQQKQAIHGLDQEQSKVSPVSRSVN